MANRSDDSVASRILGAFSFWIGLTLVGVGFGAFRGFVSPTGPGYEQGIMALVMLAGLISVYGGGLGTIAFLLAEIILARVSGAHAGRLYLYSGLLGVIITTIWGFISAEWLLPWIGSWHSSKPVGLVVYSVLFFAFSVTGSLLFLTIAQTLGILRTERPAGTKDT